MKTIKVSAPGKIHLLGEHVVVYGKPSIIGAVDKRCFVEIISRKDKTIEIVSNGIAALQVYPEQSRRARNDEKEIIKKVKVARKKWEEFSKTNNKEILKSITKDPLDYAEICVGEALLRYDQKLPSGFSLIINSEVTSGMGSSASLAVAIAGAVSLFLGKSFDKKVINEIAFNCEQKQHGFPSGGDNSVCCYGGFIWYQKRSANEKIIKDLPLKLSERISKNFFLINTGKPKESTGEMVSIVRSLVQKRPKFTDEIFNEQEILVKKLLSALENDNGGDIVEIIKKGEKNLEKLGVVSDYAKSIIREIEKSGGAAKICGAGGKTKEAGMILVYHPNINKFMSLAKKNNLMYGAAGFGEIGITIS